MAKNVSIEEKAADAILQKPFCVEIGGVTYDVAPPSIATLIEVSRLTTELPGEYINDRNLLQETLRIARDCGAIGDILATLILGAKGLVREETVEKRRLFGLVKDVSTVKVDARKELAERILKELTPQEANLMTLEILDKMQVGDFFGLTASLIEVNLLAPTKTGKAETIASGQ